MKKVGVSEAPDGVRTTFTLTQDTVEAELIIGVYNGFLLRKVGASPGAGEYTKSGTSITTGFAPAAGSSFYFFIQTATTKGMGLHEIIGTKNGTNTSFSLPVVPPADSNILLLHTTRVAEEVASSPGLGQFTISGAAITWNSVFPPRAGDVLVAYVEEDKLSTANFAPIAFTATANPLVYVTNLSASVEFTHVLLLVVGGSYLVRTNQTPAAGEFRYDDNTQQIELGAAVPATAALYGWTTNFTGRSDVNQILLTLLRDPRKTQIILVEDESLAPDGATQIHRYASEEYATLASDSPANVEYRGIVSGEPILEVERSLQEAFAGRSQLTIGDIRLLNDGELSARFGLNGNAFASRKITVEIVGRREEGYAYANRGKILVGIKGEPRRRDGEIVVPIADNFARLTVKVPTAVLTKSEFPNLPDALVGKPKPIIDGDVKHFEPLLVDPTIPRYLVAGHACEDVAVTVYDRGTPTALTVTKNNASGYFDLGGTPVGKVTCDAKGRKISGAFSNKLWDIVENKLKTDANPVFAASELDTATFLTAKRDSNYACGLATTEQADVLSALDRLVTSVIGWYVLRPDGVVAVGQLAAPASAAVLSFSDDTELYEDSFELSFVPPVWQITVHYAPLEVTFGDGEIASTVSEAGKRYLKTGYKTLEWSDATIKTKYPQAETKTIETRLLNEADAQAVLDRAKMLFGVRQARVSADFNMAPLLLRLHDTVAFTHADYDVTGNWRVVKIRETYTATRGETTVRLELWKPLS